MRRLLFACLVPLLGFTATAAAANGMTPLLVLQRLVDGDVTGEVIVSGNGIDPNRISVEDRFEVTVNGQPVDLPDEAIARLALSRRAFAYDSQSQGIVTPDARALCNMAGPAMGYVLSVRYLEYKDHRIVGDAMRPVLGHPANCLFTTLPHPQDRRSEAEAARVMGALQILLAQHGQ